MRRQRKSIIKQTNHKKELTIKLSAEAGGDDPIYIAGNFNNWNARDERFRFQAVEEGKYQLRIADKNALPALMEYKYVKGDWGSVELDEDGAYVENRKLAPHAQDEVEDFVPRWKKDGLIYNPVFYPQIRIISEAFEMPQLIKTRRVAALLPHDYFQTDKRYPVLYLQDGQNLFDDHAPFGSWGVDKRLAILAEQGFGDLIVVAIDHAQAERIVEFTPTANTRPGSGAGKKYVRFLTDTLKPYVDKHFRTLPERAFTGIGGSSMGGLISIYAGLIYPEVFSKLLILSPSLWVAPNIHFQAINFHASLDTKIYLYGGGEESKTMVPNMKRFKNAMEQQQIDAHIDFKLSIDPQGQHNEARWGQEFPQAVKWLFFSKNPKNDR